MRLFCTIALLVVISLLSLEKAQAQSASRVLNEVYVSLVDGDADRLAQYFDDRVEITIMDKGKVHSRRQASYVMKEFFNRYPSGTFTRHHVGETDGVMYALGVYNSMNGDFEVNIFIRVAQEEGWIRELRFEAR